MFLAVHPCVFTFIYIYTYVFLPLQARGTVDLEDDVPWLAAVLKQPVRIITHPSILQWNEKNYPEGAPPPDTLYGSDLQGEPICGMFSMRENDRAHFDPLMKVDRVAECDVISPQLQTELYFANTLPKANVLSAPRMLEKRPIIVQDDAPGVDERKSAKGAWEALNQEHGFGKDANTKILDTFFE